ncbi:MAG: Gfo/Idh/MocA family oxidoreductase [Clostridia bacterium]|nr:Gfo/Idh/MocA family oxidoreductase [Clostridia bacterium]
MKSAIIGYGNIAKLHAQVLSQQGHTIVAICDCDPEALRNAPGERHYTDYVAMLEAEQIDVVHICTPHYLHADMIITALEHGVNVLCEKPLCITEQDIVRVLRAAEKSDRQVGVCFQNRYNPANQAVKAYLNGKKSVCAAASVTWHRDAAYYRSGDWRGKWDTEGGGVLINQALHTLDLVQWLVGMPDVLRGTISCMTLADEIEVEDTAVILAGEKDNGFTFYATNGGATDCPVEITVKADGEWIKLMPKDVLFGNRHEHYEDAAQVLGKACYGSGHAALIADFYDCVAAGRHFAIDAKEAAKVVRLVLAAYRSKGGIEQISR